MTITQCDWWSTHTQWVIERHSRDVLIGHDASHTHTRIHVHTHSHTHTLHKPKQHIHPTHTRTHTQVSTQNQNKARERNPINKRKSRETNTRDEIGPLSLRSLITRREYTTQHPGVMVIGRSLCQILSTTLCTWRVCVCMCVSLCDGVYMRAKCLIEIGYKCDMLGVSKTNAFRTGVCGATRHLEP